MINLVFMHISVLYSGFSDLPNLFIKLLVMICVTFFNLWAGITNLEKSHSNYHLNITDFPIAFYKWYSLILINICQTLADKALHQVPRLRVAQRFHALLTFTLRTWFEFCAKEVINSAPRTDTTGRNQKGSRVWEALPSAGPVSPLEKLSQGKKQTLNDHLVGQQRSTWIIIFFSTSIVVYS